MRNYDLNKLNPLVRRFTSYDGTSTYSNVGDFRYEGSFLASGPIVKGNRKHPNAWWFAKRNRYVDPIYATWESPPDNQGRRQFDLYTGPYTQIPENLVADFSALQGTARAAALSDLLDAIRGSDLDLSIDVIQAKQTARLHQDVWKATKQLKHLLKLIPGGSLVLPLKAAGTAWLTFTYGVKPTLQSIYDVAKFNSQQYQNKVLGFEGKGRVKESRKVSLPNWPDSNYWTGICELQISVRSRYNAVLKIPDDTLTQAARLSSLNPASILWEAVPYSFVVDWFYNLGGYLRDVETRAVYNRYWLFGFYTDTYSVEHSARSTRNYTTPSGDRFTGYYSVRGSDRGLNRVMLSSLPDIPRPQFLPHLGSSRLLSAASLLTNFLGSKR